MLTVKIFLRTRDKNPLHFTPTVRWKLKATIDLYQMATTRMIGHAASSEPIKLFQNIVSSVLDDEEFNLPTEECKRSLELARFLMELCRQARYAAMLL